MRGDGRQTVFELVTDDESDNGTGSEPDHDDTTSSRQNTLDRCLRIKCREELP